MTSTVSEANQVQVSEMNSAATGCIHFFRIPSEKPGENGETTTVEEGSWWPEWASWLEAKSTPELVEPPGIGGNAFPSLCDAPGTYVLAK